MALPYEQEKKRVPDGIRKGKSRYNGVLKVLDEWETKYEDSLPKDQFEPFVKELGKHHLARIVVELPFQNTLIDVRSNENKVGKVFRFMNTELDLSLIHISEPTRPY